MMTHGSLKCQRYCNTDAAAAAAADDDDDDDDDDDPSRLRLKFPLRNWL